MRIGINRKQKIANLKSRQKELKGFTRLRTIQSGGGTTTTYSPSSSGKTIQSITIQPITFKKIPARKVRISSLKEKQRLLKAPARKLNKRMLFT